MSAFFKFVEGKETLAQFHYNSYEDVFSCESGIFEVLCDEYNNYKESIEDSGSGVDYCFITQALGNIRDELSSLSSNGDDYITFGPKGKNLVSHSFVIERFINSDISEDEWDYRVIYNDNKTL